MKLARIKTGKWRTKGRYSVKVRGYKQRFYDSKIRAKRARRVLEERRAYRRVMAKARYIRMHKEEYQLEEQQPQSLSNIEKVAPGRIEYLIRQGHKIEKMVDFKTGLDVYYDFTEDYIFLDSPD